jgi:hypothetical protein
MNYNPTGGGGAPKLIETNVKSYVQIVLNKCNENRVRLYSYVLNGLILVTFIGVVTGVLWYCHSTKLSPKERIMKFRRDQEYVLTKIRQFQMEKNAQREQFSRLVNRVKTSEPVQPPMGSVYVAQSDLDELDDLDPVGMPFSTMVPSAPNAPHYRDLMFDMAKGRA